jgi:hypothetical protein
MTRKRMVAALSIIYIINGLWDIGIFLYLSSAPSRSTNLDITPLIDSALAIYVGFQLLQLREFGRKFAIVLLYIRMAINLYFILWFPFHRESFISSSLYFLDKEIYHIANPYASEVFLFVWVLIASLTIAFLSQGEIKKLFTAIMPNDSDAIVKST